MFMKVLEQRQIDEANIPLDVPFELKKVQDEENSLMQSSVEQFGDKLGSKVEGEIINLNQLLKELPSKQDSHIIVPDSETEKTGEFFSSKRMSTSHVPMSNKSAATSRVEAIR